MSELRQSKRRRGSLCGLWIAYRVTVHTEKFQIFVGIGIRHEGGERFPKAKLRPTAHYVSPVIAGRQTEALI
jgi:hypothetical protein